MDANNHLPPVMEFGDQVQRFQEPFISAAAHLFSWPTNTVGRSPAIIPTLRRADAQLVRSLIHSLRNTITSIDDTIDNALHVVDHLHRERQRFNHHLDHHRALVAPINQLPIELLSEVFLYVRPSEGHSPQLPSVVTQVCQFWRMVAVKTPRLWTTVVVRTDDWHPDRQIERLDLWMERAGGCLVDLTMLGQNGQFEGGYGFPVQRIERLENSVEPIPQPVVYGFPLDIQKEYPERDMQFTLAHAVISYSDRLQSISLQGPNLRDVLDIWQICQRDLRLDNLKTFIVDSDRLGWDTYSSTPTDPDSRPTYTFLDTAAPNVENLSIPFSTPASLFPFRKKSIRTFAGSFKSQKEMSSLLSSARHLSVAFINTLFQSRPDPGPLPAAHSLTSLSLSVPNYYSFHGLPELPSLQHLIIVGPPHLPGHNASFDALLAFIGQVGTATLRYLAFSFQPSERDLLRCLSLTPNLEALRLRHCDRHDIQVLMDPRLVPRLTHLELDGVPRHLVKGVIQVALARMGGKQGRSRFSSDLEHASFYDISYASRAEDLEEDSAFNEDAEQLLMLGVEVITARVDPTSPRSMAFDTAYFRERGLISPFSSKY